MLRNSSRPPRKQREQAARIAHATQHLCPTTPAHEGEGRSSGARNVIFTSEDAADPPPTESYQKNPPSHPQTFATHTQQYYHEKENIPCIYIR